MGKLLIKGKAFPFGKKSKDIPKPDGKQPKQCYEWVPKYDRQVGSVKKLPRRWDECTNLHKAYVRKADVKKKVESSFCITVLCGGIWAIVF